MNLSPFCAVLGGFALVGSYLAGSLGRAKVSITLFTTSGLLLAFSAGLG